MDIVKRIEYLKKLLNKNNYLYYINQNPELNDREYDAYFLELVKLEKHLIKMAINWFKYYLML